MGIWDLMENAGSAVTDAASNAWAAVDTPAEQLAAAEGLARSGGQWLGDFMGAGPSASAPHAASAEAHTAQPTTDGDLLGSLMQGIGDFGRGVQQEGLAGLLDPFGAADRQDAQRDLASRFDVGQDGATGQNAVSEEEFQAIARQYSDIRMGRGNLRINTEGMDAAAASDFRNRTMEDVGDILQTDSGRGLIGELQHGAPGEEGEGRRLTEIRGADDVNSAVGGGRWNDADTAKVGYARYMPGETHLPGSGDYRSDIVLMHELTHAYHSTNDSWDGGGLVPGVPHDADVDLSEYQAAGLGPHAGNLYSENAYRRDRMTLTSGQRTLGGSDADLTEREFYNTEAGAPAHTH